MDLEAIVFSLILGAALWPFAQRLFSRRSRAFWATIALLWISISIGTAWLASGWRNIAIPETAILERPIQTPLDGYASSDSCRSCHPGEYDSWHSSYHRTMTQIPTPESVRGEFDDKVVDLYGHRYRLQRRGDEFWAEIDYLSPLPEQQNSYTRVWRKIVLMTGSHHMQIYWMKTDTRRLEMLPIVYLFEAGRWVPRGSCFLRPDGDVYRAEIGRWNNICIQCHTTDGRPIEHDDFDFETRVAEFGIACEACHGPAYEHITLNRPFTRRYQLALSGGGDSSIFHPKSVSTKRSSQMCGQCHGMFHVNQDNYTPDQDLAEFRTPLQKSHPEIWNSGVEILGQVYMDNLFWEDGMMRVSGREYHGLLDSPCYSHGDEEKGVMSCMSCHSMHHRADDGRERREWAEDQLKPGMRTSAACVQCHEDFLDEQRVTSHTHHAAGSSGSLCYNCHMPYTTYGLLKSMRTHTMTTPNVAVTLKTGRPNACNLCHLDKTLAWTSGKLQDWYGIASPPIEAEQEDLAASLDWMIRGDAAQRALLAWAMGWEPARKVSGVDWMTPHLARLLDDPYDAVRFIVRRSLLKQPGFADFDYDFVSSSEQRANAVIRAMELWGKQASLGRLKNPESVLIDGNGELQKERADALAARRNDRHVNLAE